MRQHSRLLATAALLAALAGCGGGDDDGGDGGADTGAADTGATDTKPTTTAPKDEGPTLNEKALERRLPAFVNSNNITVTTPGGGTAPSRPEVRSASCPDSIPARAGTTFTCALKGDGGVRGTITMTLTSDDGGRFTYKLRLRSPGGGEHESEGRVG